MRRRFARCWVLMSEKVDKKERGAMKIYKFERAVPSGALCMAAKRMPTSGHAAIAMPARYLEFECNGIYRVEALLMADVVCCC